MYLAAVTTRFVHLSLANCLDLFAREGVRGVEISVGGMHGAPHTHPHSLSETPEARAKLLDEISSRGLELVALDCHGNPLHPGEKVRNWRRQDLESAIRLASAMGVKTVVTMSGCPGSHENALHPAWIASAWPQEARDILLWQWENEVIPYWNQVAHIAANEGVRIAIEMHPSNAVYNPSTLLKLRRETSPSIGANIDASHLFWQGIEPAKAVETLEEAVHHVHAKDTALDAGLMAAYGCLDGATVLEGIERTWRFAIPGEGHGPETWLNFIKALNKCGYDGPLSIEHEARSVKPEDGLGRAARFLEDILGKL